MDIKSLISIWNHTQQHPGTSGARACAGVLLGLYNGSRFPFDLTELRLLDKPLREAALAVITCDATRCEREVHEWLRTAAAGLSFGARLEWLATDYKCFKRGACTVKSLREQYGERPRSLVIQVPSNTITGKNAASVIVDDPYVKQTGTSQAREFKVGPTLNLSYDQITQHGLQLTPEQTAAVKAAISAPTQGDVEFTYRGFKIVTNPAVPPGELWIQQSGRAQRMSRDDIDAHHRAMSTPFFNDLAG